jgi:Kef-type K+ transport system membrane component KefB
MLHLPTLLAQIAVILAVARIVGFLFRRFLRQPQVVGEMFAGILLGPSLLGWIAPGIFTTLFPADSLGSLNALSQFGLVIYMFLVGLELEPGAVRERKGTALVTGYCSIAIPFVTSIALALYLYPRLCVDTVRFDHFALFFATAMSITAFPVLARILTERKLVRTEIGALSLACAAFNDITGWCILAGVVLLVRTTESHRLWITIFGSVAYVAAMTILVRPLLKKLLKLYERRGTVSKDNLAMVVVLVVASGWVTEQLGVPALFGAFLIGTIMPKDAGFARILTEKLHDAAVVLLLPLFFAFTGLRTSIGLVRGSEMWFYCALICGVAILATFGGSTLSARASGLPWRTASTLGVLMNTRGLMELVVLNIGLEERVLSPALFTMMVIMALLTTVMTAPLLELVYFRRLVPGAVDRTLAVEPVRESRVPVVSPNEDSVA